MSISASQSLALYIHFPWCIQKCPYCDFNSHQLKNDLPEKRYISALLEDLHQTLALVDNPTYISSIFMGGGTPSLFSPDALQHLLDEIPAIIPFSEEIEITLEANPGTFESVKFHDFYSVGINRLSIGIQSFQDRHLKTLGRIHDAGQARKAIDIARQAGFKRLNLDLMFALPDQQPDEALQDINTALSFKPSHLSFYQLTLEPNTYFHRYPPRLPEDDTAYAIQQSCQQRLAEQGYQQYEISAYCQNDDYCQHNLNYWQFGDYLGIGAGAHGKFRQAKTGRIIRTVNAKNPAQYLQNPRQISIQEILTAELPLEFVMNNLRLKKGFHLQQFEQRTGLSRQALEPALSQCIQQGLLVNRQQQVYCTETGWNYLDSILEKFIP